MSVVRVLVLHGYTLFAQVRFCEAFGLTLEGEAVSQWFGALLKQVWEQVEEGVRDRGGVRDTRNIIWIYKA